MKFSVGLLSLALFIQGYNNPSSEKGDCSLLREQWKQKKSLLIERTNQLASGVLLDQSELRKIIYPEFLTYDEKVNSFECSFITLFYTLSLDRFSTISIGPFQMQLEFIKDMLDEIPEQEINSSLLLKYKKGGYRTMVDDLVQLSELENQWNILLLYERLMIKRGMLKSKNDLKKTINFYNSGKINLITSNFSKITCENRTYVDWSYLMANL